MEKDGNLGAHMHKEGWVSGSIYLERPKRNEKFSSSMVRRCYKGMDELSLG